MTVDVNEEQGSEKKRWLAVRDAARDLGINPHAALAIYRGPYTISNVSWAENLSTQNDNYAYVTEQIFKKLDTYSPEQIKSAQFLGLAMAEERRKGFATVVAASQPKESRGR